MAFKKSSSSVCKKVELQVCFLSLWLGIILNGFSELRMTKPVCKFKSQ